MDNRISLRHLLLVDENNDGRLDARVEDRDELVPLVVLLAHVDNLRHIQHKINSSKLWISSFFRATAKTYSTGTL